MLRVTVSVIFTSLSFFIYGQTDDKVENPIDKAYKSCQQENQTTMGMIDCAQKAQESWDAELNNYYKQLIVLLSPDEKDKLKKSQISWLAFRDNESLFSGTIYFNLQGSMYHVTAADRTMEIVKRRAQELKVYVDILKESK